MRHLALCLVLVFCASATHSADSSQAVAATVDAFHAAASRADQAAYLGLLTADAVFLGTDGTERWQGEEFRQFVDGHFSTGKGWTYTPTERHVTVSSQGDAAWFDEMLDHDKLGRCRGSGALVRTPVGWRIVQYNLRHL